MVETLDEEEPITTPGDMAWVPCDHAYTVKSKAGVCEACRGTGRVLTLINRKENAGRYYILGDRNG